MVNTAQTAVLLFGDREAPAALADLAAQRVDETAGIDTALQGHRRLVVVGADADLAAVLTRLLRVEAFDVEVGYVPRRATPATRAYRLPAGRRAARRASRGVAHRVPLIRDDTGTVLVGAAEWLPAGDDRLLHGEAIVDDTVLFDGDAPGVLIEPTAALPGLRARVQSGWPRRWISGRAAQLGTPGADVVRDGVPGRRAVKRSTFYRHTEGWLVVR
ncbi:peptidase M50 [Mycobacterium eburneum]|nr:peptidase M50 [Mycobacterium eburneum]